MEVQLVEEVVEKCVFYDYLQSVMPSGVPEILFETF
jgi:hypothetical protein